MSIERMNEVIIISLVTYINANVMDLLILGMYTSNFTDPRLHNNYVKYCTLL